MFYEEKFDIRKIAENYWNLSTVQFVIFEIRLQRCVRARKTSNRSEFFRAKLITVQATAQIDQNDHCPSTWFKLTRAHSSPSSRLDVCSNRIHSVNSASTRISKNTSNESWRDLNFLQNTQWKYISIYPRSRGRELQKWCVILSEVLFKNEPYFIILLFYAFFDSYYNYFLLIR